MITEGIVENTKTNKIIELGNLRIKCDRIIGLLDSTKSGFYIRDLADKLILEEVEEIKPGVLATTARAFIGEDGWILKIQ